MKTFTDYLLDFLKVLVFIGLLIWICSCNQRSAQIKRIHDYNDSVALTEVKIMKLKQHIDSLRSAHIAKYPMRAFAKNDTVGRNAYRNAEKQEYHALFKIEQAYNDTFVKYYNDSWRFKKIVDSLKLMIQ